MATASFVTYLQKPRELPVPEFRAPPPSPVTGVLTGSSSGSSSGYGDDDEIGRFLRCSARVPVLRLPEKPGPRRNKKKQAAWAPPVIDMRVMDSPSPVTGGGAPAAVEAMRSAAVAFGCFQVVGHGVDAGLLLAALRAATARERSPASEEVSGEGDEDSEELWWRPGEGEREMAGNRPSRNGAKQIRNTADDLFAQLEQASTKLLHALQQGNEAADAAEPLAKADANGSLLCIRKHRRDGSSASGPVSQDDVLRMLVRSLRCSRALALHLCPGASAFHVFSRRGWSRFRPLDSAVVVTVGDQLQPWSGGLYKSVSGKPAYSNDDLRGEGGDSAISAEFFLSCSSLSAAKDALNVDAGKAFPLNLQIMVAACLVLIYHFFISCLYAIW